MNLTFDPSRPFAVSPRYYVAVFLRLTSVGILAVLTSAILALVLTAAWVPARPWAAGVGVVTCVAIIGGHRFLGRAGLTAFDVWPMAWRRESGPAGLPLMPQLTHDFLALLLVLGGFLVSVGFLVGLLRGAVWLIPRAFSAVEGVPPSTVLTVTMLLAVVIGQWALMRLVLARDAERSLKRQLKEQQERVNRLQLERQHERSALISAVVRQGSTPDALAEAIGPRLGLSRREIGALSWLARDRLEAQFINAVHGSTSTPLSRFSTPGVIPALGSDWNADFLARATAFVVAYGAIHGGSPPRELFIKTFELDFPRAVETFFEVVQEALSSRSDEPRGRPWLP